MFKNEWAGLRAYIVCAVLRMTRVVALARQQQAIFLFILAYSAGCESSNSKDKHYN